MYERVSDQFMADVFAAVTEQEPVAALRQLSWAILRTIVSDDVVGFHRAAIGEVGLRPALSARLLSQNDDFERRIESYILAAQREGHFQRLSGAALSRTLLGAMMSNPLNRAIIGDADFQDEHKLGLYSSDAWAIFASLA